MERAHVAAFQGDFVKNTLYAKGKFFAQMFIIKRQFSENFIKMFMHHLNFGKIGNFQCSGLIHRMKRTGQLITIDHDRVREVTRRVFCELRDCGNRVAHG